MLRQDSKIPIPFDTKKLVDTHIEQIFLERSKQSSKIHPRYKALWTHISSLYSAGGKRLRPYMLVLCYSSYARHSVVDDIIPAAASLELLHQAMLIHDDIIDRDTLRHGTENITGSYLNEYKNTPLDNDSARHLADSSALLAGDLLISEAYTQMHLVACEPAIKSQALQIIHEAIFDVIGGELLDTEVSFLMDSTIDPLLIAKYKTASYSFIAPLVIGAILGGAPNDDIKVLRNFSNLLGVGFQLRDDLIGVFGDRSVTGKSINSDLEEGKRTLIIEEFYNNSTIDQKNKFNKYFGKANVSASQIELLRSLLKDTGVHDKVEILINQYADAALVQLNKLSINPSHYDAFVSLINRSTMRSF